MSAFHQPEAGAMITRVLIPSLPSRHPWQDRVSLSIGSKGRVIYTPFGVILDRARVIGVLIGYEGSRHHLRVADRTTPGVAPLRGDLPESANL